MKKYLDYVPSWLDGATTLLDKINICIARVEQGVVTEETIQDVKELKESVAALNTLSVSLSSKISSNESKTNKNTSDISKNTSDITALQTKVNKNTSDISKNTSDITALQTKVNKNTSDISKKQDALSAQSLETFIEGSDTVVVDLNESGNKINIHLENEVLNDITRSLKLPVNTPNETQVPIVLSNGSQAYENLSNIGGQSNKYYQHEVIARTEGKYSSSINYFIYSTYDKAYDIFMFQKIINGKIGILNTPAGVLFVLFTFSYVDNNILCGSAYDLDGNSIEIRIPEVLDDTIIEINYDK